MALRLPSDRFGGLRRSCPLSSLRTACVLARKLDAFWMVRETPRKFCLCAGETSALYLYGTYMKLCEGLVSGQLVGIASVSKKMTMSLCCP